MRTVIICSLLLSVMWVSCTENTINLRIQKYAKTSVISSASGAEWNSNTLFLIGDDSPYLFTLDSTWHIQSRMVLQSDTLDKRVHYSRKKDFEALALLPNDNTTDRLLLLGSGSKLHFRDTALLVDIVDNRVVHKKNMRLLYTAFEECLYLSKSPKVNIEGVVIGDEYAYISHRGNSSPPNAIFRFRTKELMNYIENIDSIIPKFNYYPINCPVLGVYQSGLSGLDIIEGRGLLMSSSVEATSGIHDGEVLGSYIAYLPFKELGNSSPKFYPVLDGGKMKITKIESVAVKSIHKGKVHFVAVSDNDDGTSELFEMEMDML